MSRNYNMTVVNAYKEYIKSLYENLYFMFIQPKDQQELSDFQKNPNPGKRILKRTKKILERYGLGIENKIIYKKKSAQKTKLNYKKFGRLFEIYAVGGSTQLKYEAIEYCRENCDCVW